MQHARSKWQRDVRRKMLIVCGASIVGAVLLAGINLIGRAASLAALHRAILESLESACEAERKCPVALTDLDLEFGRLDGATPEMLDEFCYWRLPEVPHGKHYWLERKREGSYFFPWWVRLQPCRDHAFKNRSTAGT